ncbi:MAG: glycosyltransferase [Bdellovibrionaceae bacterium]|nr:glycosyltransferase [Bdellovibrionales bacterium]MCB9255098.1 glycosyltransferase [Pseudobdellovibrionaceae bacterium]
MRSSNLAKSLSRSGYEVYVYSYTGRKSEYLSRTPSGENRISPQLVEYVDRSPLRACLQFLTYALHLPNLWFSIPWAFLQCPKHLRERIEWADLVLVDFPFHLPLLERYLENKPRILNSHNLEHEIPYGTRVLKPARLRRWLHSMETRAGKSADLVLACGAVDNQFYDGLAPSVVAVPNALDPRSFSKMGREETRREWGINNDATVFLFTASKYGPNGEAFAKLQEFHQREGAALVEHGIEILVVGSVSDKGQREPGWTVTGFVESTQPFFAAADFALNPISSGSGTNVKMFEYLVHKLPILSTHFGTRGFNLEPEKDYLPFDFVDLKDRLLQAADLSKAARLAMAESAFLRNQSLCDMDRVVQDRVVPALTTFFAASTAAPNS